ncbi:kelch repeat and BTB domain-containing protein 3-like [Oculina patagonica]
MQQKNQAGTQVIMTSRGQHFCNNIKAFHKKREEQFYDFTIKDKDGAEIRSHKLILASQSEYFDALFRIDPTASEATFKDFSIDVIKECIEYLYVFDVNLSGDNVQDVLMFADYITLTDVIAICTDYIIKNIDRSNYAHVINLGNSRGMYNMVEAGVLFTMRNLTQNVDSFDELTRKIIIKVADRQQQLPVTVMTTEQWNINRLKKFLLAPEEEMVIQARSSSVYDRGPRSEHVDRWGPKLAINGEISIFDSCFYHSRLEMNPWLEVKFPSPILVSSVTIVNRLSGCWERLRNVEVRAGMSPVPEGFTAHERGNDTSKKLEVNSRCGHFAGPAGRFIAEGHVVTFDQPTLAQYITLQILEAGYLQINGLKINGGDLLNYNDHF